MTRPRRRRGDVEEPASGEAPWYADGLRFFCTACGACCTGVPGYVWVQPDDVERMAASLGISARRFKRLYTRKAKGKLSLRERENGDCILLKNDRCTVYDAKPTRCSTFPFWPEVLGHPDEWRETRSRCEGIDRGHHYDRPAIERLLAGDDAPMRERQALPEPEPASEPVADGPDWDAALADLERLYAELEQELPRYQFTCAASGNCCDFDAWGHRLYVTTLEAEHFFRRAGEPRERGRAALPGVGGGPPLPRARGPHARLPHLLLRAVPGRAARRRLRALPRAALERSTSATASSTPTGT